MKVFCGIIFKKCKNKPLWETLYILKNISFYEFGVSDLEFIIHLAFDPVFVLEKNIRNRRIWFSSLDLDSLIDLEHTII